MEVGEERGGLRRRGEVFVGGEGRGRGRGRGKGFSKGGKGG